MRWVRRILLIALLVALPVGVHLFVTRNSEPVAIDYVAGSLEGLPLWAVLLGTFAAGCLVTLLLAMLRGARLRLQVRRYRRATRDLESEVHQLRNLPLSDEAPAPPATEELAPAVGLERGT